MLSPAKAVLSCAKGKGTDILGGHISCRSRQIVFRYTPVLPICGSARKSNLSLCTFGFVGIVFEWFIGGSNALKNTELSASEVVKLPKTVGPINAYGNLVQLDVSWHSW